MLDQEAFEMFFEYDVTGWPPEEAGVMHEYSHEGRKIVTAGYPAGHIEAFMFDHDGSQLAHVVSQRLALFGEGQHVLLIGVGWDPNDEFKMHFGTELASPFKPPFVIHARVPAPNNHTRDEAAIEFAVKNRKKALRDKNLNPSQRAKRWAVFERELRLLRADLAALLEGDEDRVVTVSLYLRKLIGPNSGNRLLQDVASFLKAPLLVWRRAIEHDMPLSVQPKLRFFINTESVGSLEPIYPFDCETDLDAWLKLDAHYFGGGSATTEKLLLEIADKIGAHAQLKGADLADALAACKSGGSDMLNTFLEQLAATVLALGDRIISLRDHP
jgi:hypothetical protein